MTSIIDINEKNRKEKILEYYQKIYPNKEIKIIFEVQSNREKDFVVAINEETKCWEVISHLNGNPYPMFRKERAHVLLYKKFKGEIPDGLVIRHTCDNCRCCNLEHLILGTQKDNIYDIWERSRGSTILTKEKIKEVALDNTGNYSQLAKKYNVSRSMIERIKGKKFRTFKEYDSITLEKQTLKLKSKDVLEIFHSTKSAKELAQKYNISTYTVYDIKKKRYHKKLLEGEE